MTKSYDNLKTEEAMDRELKASIARGDSEKKIDALIEQYEFLRSPQSPEFFSELERDWKMRI